MRNVEDRVKSIIAACLNVDESRVTDDALIIEDLGADSLDTIEVVMALEMEFDIAIPDADAEKINTVRDVVKWLEAQPEGVIRPWIPAKINHG